MQKRRFAGLAARAGRIQSAARFASRFEPAGYARKTEKSPIEPPKDTPSPLDKKSRNHPTEPPKELKSNAKPAVGEMDIKPEPPKKGASNQPSLEAKCRNERTKIQLADAAAGNHAARNRPRKTRRP